MEIMILIVLGLGIVGTVFYINRKNSGGGTTGGRNKDLGDAQKK